MHIAPAQQHQFKTEGWACITTPPVSATVEAVVHAKELILQTAWAEATRRTNANLSRYDAAHKRTFEIAKAIVRGVLRYQPTAQQLVAQVGHVVAGMSGLQNTYITRPYVICHVPGDLSEKGGRHIDAFNYIPNFYTIWTPLNHCHAEPLTLYKYSHTFPRKQLYYLQERAPVKNIPWLRDALTNTFSPSLDQGSFLTWDGHTQHQGNENRTDAPTLALVVRLTDKPIMFEPTAPLAACGTPPAFLAPLTAPSAANFASNFWQLVTELTTKTKIATKITPQTLQELYGTLAAKGWSEQEKHQASFGLTLFSQRLNIHENCTWVDASALLLAQDNLLSIHQLLDQMKKYQSATSADLTAVATWFMEYCPSQQLAFLLDDYAKRNPALLTRTWQEKWPDAPLLTWQNAAPAALRSAA